MEFKFNFQQSENGTDPSKHIKCFDVVFQKEDEDRKTESKNVQPAKEVVVEERPKNVQPAKEVVVEARHKKVGQQYLSKGSLAILPLNHFNEQYDLHYVPSSVVETEFVQYFSQENSLHKAYQLSSDLIAWEYEGGMKLWECAVDLVNYLNDNEIYFKTCKVLELGCGAGLPGIFCLLNNATVHFQDYNEEVINLITIPNVYVNCKNHEVPFDTVPCKFFSGDWGRLADTYANLRDNERYDYILMSETIYNPENYDALYQLLRKCIKKSGEIFVAAKSCYFGVGGSTEQFKQFVMACGDFNIYSCKIFGQGIKREIFILRLKQD